MAEYLFKGYGVKPVIIVESYDELVPAKQYLDRRTDQLISTLELAVPNLAFAILIGRTSAACGKLQCVQIEGVFARPRWAG